MALLAVDAASRTLLGLDVPLLTIIVVVIAVASFEPVSSWVRARSSGDSPAAIARARLMTALGQRALAAQAADAGVQPALTRVTQALDLAGAVVIRQDGSIAAAEGFDARSGHRTGDQPWSPRTR